VLLDPKQGISSFLTAGIRRYKRYPSHNKAINIDTHLRCSSDLGIMNESGAAFWCGEDYEVARIQQKYRLISIGRLLIGKAKLASSDYINLKRDSLKTILKNKDQNRSNCRVIIFLRSLPISEIT